MASSSKPAKDIDDSAVKSSETVQSNAHLSKKMISKEVLDSWEDDESSSEDERSQPRARHVTPDSNDAETNRNNVDRDSVEFENPYSSQLGNSIFSSMATRGDAPSKRPEKSTVAVNRMIANSLGLRTRMTAEQRAFHQSQVENEKKRRMAEKTKKSEEERLKESIWNE